MSLRPLLDDLGYALEINLTEFRRRPWLEHVAEWAAYLITRLL